MQANTPLPQVSFRPVKDTDHDFLLGLYASTRAWERKAANWTDADWQDFISRQFKAQDMSYKMSFPGASFTVIQMGDTAIGRLYVERQDDCLRIIEFTLAPAWQRRGIGTDILRALMNEAHGGKVPVRLSVQKNSPAITLYQRHGFVPVGDMNSHIAMEWTPATGPREI
ncbi:Ribosomal protein S18 acetylase RimI [Roseovarius lutimaris]|uniref:Ribosomal protein S18 acetylase RimI n=1 Tax=Roseovarius lutimaris TaxID=1005928 RepID=A0A1I5GBZ3_9RHOB|nr:GNAT family N-acetyltransferase [Roseovarius lutimaris]SFO33470.1 Ribosomal protein S18 acetylase RimI [Roseovarius lutimaris]